MFFLSVIRERNRTKKKKQGESRFLILDQSSIRLITDNNTLLVSVCWCRPVLGRLCLAPRCLLGSYHSIWQMGFWLKDSYKESVTSCNCTAKTECVIMTQPHTPSPSANVQFDKSFLRPSFTSSSLAPLHVWTLTCYFYSAKLGRAHSHSHIHLWQTKSRVSQRTKGLPFPAKNSIHKE